MRRLIATVLLFLFSFSLIGPALFAETPQNLPACCRKSGKHHCLMTGGGSAQSSGVAVRAAAEKCPFYQIGQTFPAQGKFTATSKLGSLFRPLFVSRNLLSADRNSHESAATDSVSPRGPPLLLG